MIMGMHLMGTMEVDRSVVMAMAPVQSFQMMMEALTGAAVAAAAAAAKEEEQGEALMTGTMILQAVVEALKAVAAEAMTLILRSDALKLDN
jgi:hypothetical protein